MHYRNLKIIQTRSIDIIPSFSSVGDDVGFVVGNNELLPISDIPSIELLEYCKIKEHLIVLPNNTSVFLGGLGNSHSFLDIFIQLYENK